MPPDIRSEPEAQNVAFVHLYKTALPAQSTIVRAIPRRRSIRQATTVFSVGAKAGIFNACAFVSGRQALMGLTANKSLQLTFDPLPIFAAAKTVIASNATELKR